MTTVCYICKGSECGDWVRGDAAWLGIMVRRGCISDLATVPPPMNRNRYGTRTGPTSGWF